MRYIDTGTRDAQQALGTWLLSVLNTSVSAVRWQTGFFGEDALGLFVPTMARLQRLDRAVRVIVGSNDGTTRRSDVESLIRVVGSPRANLRIGIVSFDNGYFHPKTIHVSRKDGSATAYVGSANLTGSGVASLNVEAGILLDTRTHDDPVVLAQIAKAIDWWFATPRQGLSLVSKPSDLDALVKNGILDVPYPPTPLRPTPKHKSKTGCRGVVLKPLLKLPGLLPAAAGSLPSSKRRPGTVAKPPLQSAQIAPAQWTKRLSRSDAQRKKSGHQRGSITLVRAGHPIDAQTYFRREFFKSAKWKSEITHTGEKRETAQVPFRVVFLGKKLGVRNIWVTHAANRESGQANYTSLFHLGPLAPYFSRHNLTSHELDLSRHADGSYSLHIRPPKP